MGRKFIPNGDLDFLTMADVFARTIAGDPAQFAVAQKDSEALSAAVTAYRDALNVARMGGARSQVATRAKDEARADAERLIRRFANLIRANDEVDAAAKRSLQLGERPAKAKQKTCPQEPPRLKFVRALHEGGGAGPMHELSFKPMKAFTSGKPAGAVRLELFVDLVPPHEPIPRHPGANLGGRPWYLRSYTRSPIVLAPPTTRVPMRVMYWGRWADSTGNVGPFSATAVAWVEGGSHQYLLGPGVRKDIPLLEDAAATGPDGRDSTYSAAVLDAHYRSINASDVVQISLPSPEEIDAAREQDPSERAA